MYSYTASHMGTLDVYMSDDSGSTLLFTKSGNQGNIWRQAEIYIPDVDNLKVSKVELIFLWENILFETSICIHFMHDFENLIL